MESTSPYRTPNADVQPPTEGGSDLTPPYSPAGRFGRLSYIAWATLASVAGQLIMMIAGGGAAIGLPSATGEAAPPEIGTAVLVVFLLVGVATLIITIIFAVRRCHDIDISGWWNLLILIPIVNVVYGLFLVLKPGTDGPNRFGPGRATPLWEQVVGIIGIVLIAVALIGAIATIAIPAFMGFPEIPSQVNM